MLACCIASCYEPQILKWHDSGSWLVVHVHDDLFENGLQGGVRIRRVLAHPLPALAMMRLCLLHLFQHLQCLDNAFKFMRLQAYSSSVLQLPLHDTSVALIPCPIMGMQ